MRTSLVLDGTRYFWLDDDQMVSMRYARNLADGVGFVWNAGERVEGYTSVGWALVMAAVHMLPLTDATFPLAVKIVAWLLGCSVIVLTDRMLRVFVPRDGLARAATLIPLALCFDLVFWSANGFETTLLTMLFVFALLRILEDSERAVARVSTFVLVGMLPLARSDAFHLSAALLLVALGLGVCRAGSAGALRFSKLVAFAALAPAIHLVLRRWYYGDWLPNTYYLKISGYPGRFRSGFEYLKEFSLTYTVVVLLVLAYAWWSRASRGRWIVAAALLSVAHVLVVGADLFPHFRYVAPWIPVLLVLAAAACVEFAATAPIARRVLLAILAVTTIIGSGIHGRGTLAMLRIGNGVPETGLIAGVMIRQQARPEAAIAVTAAGIAPYFSRRPAIDILGKTDAHVARLERHPGGRIGHGKFDIDYSLSREPALIVTPWPADFSIEGLDPAYAASPFLDGDYRVAFLRTRRFVDDYKPSALRVRYTLPDGEVQESTIYARQSTAEAATLRGWIAPRIER
jgi:hypothetical protein